MTARPHPYTKPAPYKLRPMKKVKQELQDYEAKMGPMMAHAYAPEVLGRDVVELLLAAAPGQILLPGQLPHAAQMVNNGEYFSKTQRTIRGTPRECHTNCLREVLLHPDRYTMYTGFAYTWTLALWVEHSWLVNRRHEVTETTAPRDLYYGVALTSDEVMDWALEGLEGE